MVRFEVLEPQSLSEACSLLSEHQDDAKIIAGGQSLLILLKHRLLRPKYLINIKGLSELEYVSEDKEGLRIGSMVTHRAIETSSVIRSKFPILSEMEKFLASVQIRNWGTIVGDLCHADPAGDPAPALIALGTKVKVASTHGKREIALDEFFIDFFETALRPDEIVEEIILPYPSLRTGSCYKKESVRLGDTAIVGIAVSIRKNKDDRVEDSRVVIGGAGPIPIRLREAEKVIVGEKIGTKLAEEAAVLASKEAQLIRDIRGSVEYKREIVNVLTRRVITEALERAGA